MIVNPTGKKARKRQCRWWSLSCLLLFFSPSHAHAQERECAALSSLSLPDVEIIKAERIVGSYTEDFQVGRAARTYDGLPAFCRVYGRVRPVAGSEIDFDIWMPEKGWNGRLHMVGNGAYVSNISYELLVMRLLEGDIAVGTDTGHKGADLRFGWKKPEKIVDFAYRAVHESVVAAKAISKRYYRRSPDHSYFSGCSTGGYQALSEAQRFPGDFDGIIAGAPGNNRTNLTLSFIWSYLANHRPGDNDNPILSKSDLLLINRAVTRKCDKDDGVEDGVISEPLQCRFRLETLQCRAGATGDCLSADQIEAAYRVYQGPRDTRSGRQIYPAFPLGSEGVLDDAGDNTPGWSGFWADSDNPSAPARADMFRYWVFDDPDWNWWDFDWGDDVDTVDERLAGHFNAVSPNLTAFEQRGGKMIMFMGWLDPIGSAIEAVNYYRQVEDLAPFVTEAERRAHTQQFLRLYMVAGMGHCAEGPGASAFSTATRDSVPPVLDAKHDMLRALQDWVEKDVAPRSLIATKYAEGSEGTPADREIDFQRPVCVYPERPIYRGGPADEASSFTCEPPDI